MPFDLLVQNTSEVVTAQGDLSEGAEKALRPIARSAVGCVGGRIAFLGPEADLPKDSVGPATKVVDAQGGFVSPGLIDPHTHLVFAGDRSVEFELRNRGASYQEIAQAGGGIANTVRATRAASEDELVALALPRLRRLLEHGVVKAEVKSGYGLDLETELKMLRVIRELGKRQPIGLTATLLCAHAVPAEYQTRRAEYVDLCVREIIPRVAEDRLATFIDAFVEEGAFTREEGLRILEAGRAAGLVPRLHADQLSASGGAQLAAELGASSADHLEHVSDEGIAEMARARVSAILVPTSTLFLRMSRYAPGRKLVAAGVNVALGTNVNPGSAMSESVPLAMGLACLHNGLTPAEALWAFTRGAAVALRLPDAGRLVPGGAADLVVFGCTTYRHLPYHLAMNHARQVIAGGRIVHETVAPGCL